MATRSETKTSAKMLKTTSGKVSKKAAVKALALAGTLVPTKTSMPPKKAAKRKPESHAESDGRELVILTGMSGSGKASALKAFEDLGFYSVDNLPLDLVSRFADLVLKSAEITHAALVVDVREGARLERFPAILQQVRKVLPTRVLFLEASEDAIVRRFSETRRPHPMGRDPGGKGETVIASIRAERKRLDPVRNVADILLDTTRFNVHELRAHINAQFARGGGKSDRNLTISVTSFGFKNGVPTDADLVFDVRFLPNPHFVPEFRKLTGKHPKVAKYVRQFPQTKEFLDKATEMLTFLLPHYIHEGKSYLTIGIGCTGGQHRSVMITEELKKRLGAAGYRAKSAHRDMPR